MGTVADRFGFPPSEIAALPLRDLRWWYDIAVEFYRRDAEVIQRANVL